MALANDKTVRANFNNASFEHNGTVSTFFRRDNGFFVHTEGPDSRQAEFEIKYTFAYEPLQQYLADIGGGRLQALDLAWDTEKQQWFWLGEAKPAKPGSTYHWTGPFYRWNRTCIDCHSTDPRANFQPETNEYKSSYVATSIGCQSCHGAGAKHVAWAAEKTRDAKMFTPSNLGLSKVDASACFACHARRTKLLDGYQPGKPFLDYFSPALLRPDLYFPDGQILDEVFEYGSFQQSKMARAGVTCLDCHTQHEAALKAQGNALCTQCHTKVAPERFVKFNPGGDFDTPAHTHHPVGSTGAQCTNCHMPERTYMKVDPRRDHSFVIPRPDLSAAYGTPNACTTCHEGKTNAWAGDNMDKWYGKAWRERPTTAHAFAGAAQNDPASIDALRKIVADREQAGIVRGSAVAAMSRVGGIDIAADVKAAAEDPDPLVRLGAAEGGANLPPEHRLDAIGRSLPTTHAPCAWRLLPLSAALPRSVCWVTRERTSTPRSKTCVPMLRPMPTSPRHRTILGPFCSVSNALARPKEHSARRSLSIRRFPVLASTLPNFTGRQDRTKSRNRPTQKRSQCHPIRPIFAMDTLCRSFAKKRCQKQSGSWTRLSGLIPATAGTRQHLPLRSIPPGAPRMLSRCSILRLQGGETDASLLGAAIQYGLKLRRYPETLKYAEALARQRLDDPQLAELIRQLRAATGGK